MPVKPAIIPSLRYVDAIAAIDFLCRAFGFERHAVFTDEADATIVHHAQLVLDGNMIMLGSARPTPGQPDFRLKTAAEAGGVTMTVYVVVDAIEEHFARAEAAGAEVITALKDNDGYPGQGYNVRDPEGNVWSFGSYDPFGE
jgi:uncharacterized glyoxalase superfamily protein PhnB